MSGRQLGFDEDRIYDLYLRDAGKVSFLSGRDEGRLITRKENGDSGARATLINSFLPLVISIAKKYLHHGLPLLDLIMEGNIGLCDELDDFDRTRCIRLISYATGRIRQAILNSLSDQVRIIRLPRNQVATLIAIGRAKSLLEQSLDHKPSPDEIATYLKLSLKSAKFTLSLPDANIDGLDFSSGGETSCDELCDESQPGLDMMVVRNELHDTINRLLSSLSPMESEIIDLFFGINSLKVFTIKELAERFTLSISRVRQIRDKGIERLQYPSRSDQLLPYWSSLNHRNVNIRKGR